MRHTWVLPSMCFHPTTKRTAVSLYRSYPSERREEIAMMEQRKYGGSAGMPIEYPKRASAQRQRQTDSQQYDSYADENPDAWTQPKQHSSVVRLDRLPRRETTNL